MQFLTLARLENELIGCTGEKEIASDEAFFLLAGGKPIRWLEVKYVGLNVTKHELVDTRVGQVNS